MVATDFAFAPREVRFQADTTYNLVLDNRGALVHDLTIEGIGFQLVADPGAAEAGSLGDVEPGQYEFRCSIPGHAEAGMTGVLIVSP